MSQYEENSKLTWLIALILKPTIKKCIQFFKIFENIEGK